MPFIRVESRAMWGVLRVSASCIMLSLGAASFAGAQGVEGVGRFETSTKGAFCTGTLVAQDIVLTAAHCVAKWTGETSPVTNEFSFRPGKLRASPAIGVKRVVLHPLYRRALNDLQKLRFDLALVQLDAPVPEAVSGVLGYGVEAQQGERLYIVSWRGADTSQPRQKACPVRHGYPGLVTLSCEVRGGESGSPVLRHGEEGLEVVAVVSSRLTLGDSPVAQASNVVIRLPALLLELDRALKDEAS